MTTIKLTLLVTRLVCSRLLFRAVEMSAILVILRAIGRVLQSRTPVRLRVLRVAKPFLTRVRLFRTGLPKCGVAMMMLLRMTVNVPYGSGLLGM